MARLHRACAALVAVICAVVWGVVPATATTEADQAASPVAIQRIGGDDRYLTAAATSLVNHVPGGVLYVATGRNYPDALAAASLSKHDSQVLLVHTGHLLPEIEVAAALLRPRSIILVGGPDVVPPVVAEKLGRYGQDAPVRLAGQSRYETAIAVSRHAYPQGSDTVYLTSGTTYRDTLLATVVGARADGPILFSREDRLVATTAQELARLQPSRIIALGTSLEESTLATAAAIAPVERMEAEDLYRTDPGGHAVLVTDRDFPDALAGAALASRSGGQLILVPGELDHQSRHQLVSSQPAQVYLIGQDAALHSRVESQVAAALGGGQVRPTIDVQRGDSPLTGEPRPLIAAVAHQDDETLFLSPGLLRARRAGRDVHVVVYTDGAATVARTRVNNRLADEGLPPLSLRQWTEARNREVVASMRHLDIDADFITFVGYADGALSSTQVRTALSGLLQEYPDAEVHSQSMVDPHPDHVAVGTGAAALRAEGQIPGGLHWYVAYPHLSLQAAHFGGQPSQMRPTASERQALNPALEEFSLWRPSAGRYAIGYTSVGSLFRHQLSAQAYFGRYLAF